MIPTAISPVGTGLQPKTLAFIGWFGPRETELAVFALLLIQDTRASLRHEIFIVVLTTVLMSVFAHGITAVPASKWYADRTQAAESIVYLAEHKQIKELPFCCWMSAEDSPDQEVSPT